MCAIFLKKVRKRTKKVKGHKWALKIWAKIWAKIYNILYKGRRLFEIIAHNKLLE